MLSTQVNGFRYFVELAFNGTDFHGWQIQPGAITVQETLNQTIGTLLGHPVNLVGCGRTDAGVHASHFVAHFETIEPLPDPDEITNRLNRFLKNSIRIYRVVQVKPEDHARFHATARTYHYLISRRRHPFMENFSWNLSMSLNVDAMNQGAAFLIGKKDFTSFSKLHTDVKTNICQVSKAIWTPYTDMLVFQITADRFLRNMVRAIVGTLIEVGKGNLSPQEISIILDSLDRSAAGMSVPANGLFLTQVEYPQEIFTSSPKSPFLKWI